MTQLLVTPRASTGLFGKVGKIFCSLYVSQHIIQFYSCIYCYKQKWKLASFYLAHPVHDRKVAEGQRAIEQVYVATHADNVGRNPKCLNLV